MSFYGEGSKYIQCPYCDEYRTARGMYWHFKIDHKMSRDDAYDEVANCLHDEYHDMSSGRYHGFQPEWRR